MLIGRKKELERLREIFREVKEGKGITVFVFGETGVGKAALVKEFVSRVDANFIEYRFMEGAAEPYAPFQVLLKALKDQEVSGDAADKAAELLAVGSRKGAGRGREELFDAVVEAVRTAAAEKPLVFFVDNIHWGDPDSISLFCHLAGGISRSRVLLIGAYVLEKLSGSDGREHPLVEAMAELVMAQLVSSIKLEPLTPDEVEEYVADRLGAEPPKALVVSLYSATRGNPLFLKEMLSDLIERYGIDTSDPEWRKKISSAKMSLPGTLREAISSTLSSLSDRERELLEVAALYGGSLPEAVAARVLGWEDVFDVFMSLVEKGVLEKTEDGYSVHHTLMAEVVRDSVPSERAREIHERLYNACLEEGTPPYITGRQAHEAGLWKEAAEKFYEAAREAMKRLAFDQARAMAGTAAEDARRAGEEELELDSLLLLGEILGILGDWEEASKVLSGVARKDRGERGAEASLRLGHIARNRSQWEDASMWYSRALSLVDEKSRIAADAYRGMGKIYWRKGEMEKAMFHTERVIGIAKELGEEAILGSAKIDLANIYHDGGGGGMPSHSTRRQ